MRFDISASALRLVAIALFSVFLASCGKGEGPEQVVDPLFVNVLPPPAPVATSPAVAAPTPPARNAADVVSLFSDAYADVTVDTWNAGFSVADLTAPDFMVGGDAIKEYTNLVFSGIETVANTVDASGMTNFSMDIWTPDDTGGGQAFNIKWVDTGPNGMVEFPSVDNLEAELIFTAPALATGSWVTIDIPLADFTAAGLTANTQLAQLIISGGLSTVYIDNVYFYRTAGGAGGELLTNGTFETGDTAGWTLIPNSGTFTATMDQATGPGAWSGNLVASVPGGGGPASFPVATQPNLAVGTVMPNQSVTVSFDYCGELTGPGGVLQAALLSEIAGGMGASKTDAMLGNITPTATWQQYSFTGLTGADVTGGITLQLKADCGGNPGCIVNAYLDNVSVVLDGDTGNVNGAGGACPAAPPPPAPDGLPVDFEDAGGPYVFGDFGGGVTTIINNPDMTGNPSAKVAQMEKFAGAPFGATTLTLDGPIDFSSSSVITMKVWSQRVANVEFKVEGQPGNVTVIQPTSGIPGGVWETLTFDFTGLISDPVSAVSIFFDNGTPGDAGGDPVAWTFYVDDIEIFAPPPPVTGLPVDFEDAGGPYVFGDFGGGVTTIINNPDMTGNPSAKVAQMEKFAGAPFGATTLTLDGPIDFSSSSVITMKVWSQRVANVEFKVEGQPGNVTVIQPTSGIPGGVWETLTFDFTGLISAPVSAVSIFFDNGTPGDAGGDPVAWTFYVDDIELGAGGGGASGEQAVNGDFETGDNAGWTEFPGGGIISYEATPGIPLSGGSFSGRLQAAAGQDVIFKQANLAVGGVSPGDTIVVSFDLYGSLTGISGVVFGEFFSEVSGGGTSAADFISPGGTNAPLTPTATWTTYTNTVTAGPDVSGGITLQLKAGCGAVVGCAVDAYFDNISIDIQ